MVSAARSCAACHHLGGLGGAGGRAADVDHLHRANQQPIVLHKHAVDESYYTWREGVTSQALRRNNRSAQLTRRNTPALFGASLIDAIPDKVIVDNVARAPAKVRGTPSRGADGRVIRFGWKGDIRTLRDFVEQACAVELGLSTRSHSAPADPRGLVSSPQGQAADLLADEAPTTSVDMSDAQVEAVVAFIRRLKKPKDNPGHPGRALFERAGCSDCHTPDLGQATGIYSDLAMHDMGQELAGRGGAYGRQRVNVSANTWRTPPLWGVGDSAPYLHDGRADTLYEAIRLHGGQAQEASRAFALMDPDEQKALQAFLLTLEAPDAAH